MAGGKGTRLSPLKPVLKVCEKPMIWWVVEIAKEFANNVYVATVKGHPAERELWSIHSRVIYTSGLGYENDVIEALSSVELPALVLPSDVPFISRQAIETLLNQCKASICTLICETSFIGVSLWNQMRLNDYQDIPFPQRIINVNTQEDLQEINKLCHDKSP
ncbi:NTP transferase domain-containing protein [Metallosphaera hakonensis JCM 8857 = DSM 7519]|uniref:Cobalamin biosynthesis protein CobY n=2 Tax=Metallosphaera hakonensis TaxID=79601 RepID=A0A2U9IWR0_9CREN|nr:NTP transferase domain-containing protein [Metallosphaera hakonensis JCM 8857 = DSM 7519]